MNKLTKENCPYCDMALDVTGDSDRSVFNWHLSGHGEPIAENDAEISELESEFNIKHIEIENPLWVKALFSSNSDNEKSEVIYLICSRVNKLVEEIKNYKLNEVQ